MCVCVCSSKEGWATKRTRVHHHCPKPDDTAGTSSFKHEHISGTRGWMCARAMATDGDASTEHAGDGELTAGQLRSVSLTI